MGMAAAFVAGVTVRLMAFSSMALLAEVRAAGSWKRYANEPRVQLVVLRKLAENGRARVPRYHCMHTRLFARRTLPDVLFWKILEFWRTDRDP